MITATYLKGYSMNPLLKIVKRCILKVRMHWLYSDLDYYHWQQKSGIAGSFSTQRKIVNLESELRDLQ